MTSKALVMRAKLEHCDVTPNYNAFTYNKDNNIIQRQTTKYKRMFEN